MAGGGGTEESTLEDTPTWALASVCFILISFSVIIEFLIHLLAKYFRKTRRKSLIQALDKIKSELMLLGFISLLLTVCEKPISNFCIPRSVGESFLPCDHKILSSDIKEEASCMAEGKVSLMSRSGVRELQYLIFVLASFHSLSCILIFGLGMAKMSRWELWEAETKTLEYQFSKDPRKFQLTHQTSFGKRHLGFSEHKLLRWPICFLRQFYGSVPRVDYLTLRHGFIMAHFEQGSNFVFDFQKYTRRALEKDFGVVAGISLWIWMFAISYIFFNASKFRSYMWLPFIPLLMLLLVGTKLQSIITSMCLDSHDKSHVVRGPLLVRPSDHFFWFRRPELLLQIIHFIFFQNSFQLAFFTWTSFKFGLKSCFHPQTHDIVIRLFMGVLVHFLCGYVTLPLYALVTQMGTRMREAVFPENVVEGLQRWRARARKKLKRSSQLGSPILSRDASISLISNSLPNSPDASHTTTQLSDGPLLSPTKLDVVIQVQNGQDQAHQGHRKMGSFKSFELSKAT